MADYPYQISSPEGSVVLQAPENCRYPRMIELSLMEAGYTIRLHGKRLTKAEVRKEVNRK